VLELLLIGRSEMIQNAIIKYRRLSVMKKIALSGSIASIMGLCLMFLPIFNAKSSDQITHGEKSPAIGTVEGNVIIDYSNNSSTDTKAEKRYVLRNTNGGSVLVINNPDMSTAVDPKSHVCTVVAGTPIELLDETAKHAGIEMWQKVRILAGPNKDKVGWIVNQNISYE
jgi:hypothetical protein